MKLTLPLLLIAFLVGCDFKTTSTLHVLDSGLQMNDEDGRSNFMIKGQYLVKLDIDEDGDDPSTLEIQMPNEDTVEFEVNLPSTDILLHTNEPLRISSSELGQPVAMVVDREVHLKKDRISITITDKNFENVLATVQFRHKSDVRAYDEDSGTFLQSYQKVRMTERGVVFKIDGDLDGRNNGLSFKGVLDALVNYGAMIYIAPWVYTRYWKVRWVLDDNQHEEGFEAGQWKEVIDASPQVDYFSYVHSGDQYINGRNSFENVRNNQLRLMYSSACNGKANTNFLGGQNVSREIQNDYEGPGFAVTSGHKGLSASPIFEFSVVKYWAYGMNYRNVLKSSWRTGTALVRGIEWAIFGPLWEDYTGVLLWDNVDHMFESSMMMVGHTSDLPPDNMFITRSAAPKRSENFNPEEAIVKRVDEL